MRGSPFLRLLRLACLFAAGAGAIAIAQDSTFRPGQNPVSNQAWSAVAITPSSASIAVTRAIYNGAAAACNIVITPNGTTTQVTFQNVQPGEILPVQAIVVASSTTCTNLLALY